MILNYFQKYYVNTYIAILYHVGKAGEKCQTDREDTRGDDDIRVFGEVRILFTEKNKFIRTHKITKRFSIWVSITQMTCF